VVSWFRTTGEMPHGHGFGPPMGSSEKATVAGSSPISGLDSPPGDYSRVAVNRVVIGLRWMARPGLEPGTPRFSDVRSKPSNRAANPANRRVESKVSRAWIPVDSILSMGIRAMPVVSSPFRAVGCSNRAVSGVAGFDAVGLRPECGLPRLGLNPVVASRFSSALGLLTHRPCRFCFSRKAGASRETDLASA
jgi:hypothetical protein